MNSRNLVYGTILILLGAAFLARNLGLLPGIPWAAIWQLWPVFLIVFGLQLLFPKGPLSALAPIVLILALLFAIFGWIPLFGSHVLPGTASLELPEGVVSASLTLESMPFGNLQLVASDLADQEGLVYESTFAGMTSDTSFSDRPTEIAYTLTGPSQRRWVTSLLGSDLSFQLNRNLSWTVDLELLIGSAVIDLQEVDWRGGSLRTAIGSFVIRCGPTLLDRSFRIDNGIGAVRLDLLRGQSYAITLDSPGFLHSLEANGFQKQGDRYLSPEYSADRPTTHILIAGGLTQVSVRWIDVPHTIQ